MPEQQTCTYADCQQPAAISPAGLHLLCWRCREHVTLAPGFQLVRAADVAEIARLIKTEPWDEGDTREEFEAWNAAVAATLSRLGYSGQEGGAA